MKFGKWTVAASLALCLGLSSSAFGTMFWKETFTYPDGDLTLGAGAGGDVSGGVWTGHSGQGNLIPQVVSGQVVLAQGAGSREDSNRTVPAMGAGETYYAGFDVTVTGSAAATTVYFAHFMSSATTFNGRAFIAPPGGGGDYTFGLSGTSTLGSTWATDFSYGSTHRIVIEYDFDSGDSRLWVDAANIGDTALSFDGAFSDAINAFGLRQAAGNTGQIIDNLVLGTTFAEVVPEPATLALLGLGAVSVLRRRR